MALAWNTGLSMSHTSCESLHNHFILHKKRYPLIVVEYKKHGSYYKALRRDEERFVNYFVRRYLKVHAEHL